MEDGARVGGYNVQGCNGDELTVARPGTSCAHRTPGGTTRRLRTWRATLDEELSTLARRLPAKAGRWRTLQPLLDEGGEGGGAALRAEGGVAPRRARARLHLTLGGRPRITRRQV